MPEQWVNKWALHGAAAPPPPPRRSPGSGPAGARLVSLLRWPDALKRRVPSCLHQMPQLQLRVRTRARAGQQLFTVC